MPTAGDNCETKANADQIDTGEDGAGDACDTNDDGDALVDGEDACPTESGTASNGCNQGDCVSYIATRGKNQPAGAR